MKFDLILQNNSTKEFFLFNGLENVSLSHLYIQFDNIDLDIPSGEYTYVAIENSRNDVEYEFKTPILDTIIKTTDGNVKLEDLHPRIGLLRVGEITDVNIYDKNNEGLIFYED